MDFVIDNSIVMTWCFNNESNIYAESVLDRLSEKSAIAPSIWPLEVGNVLLVAERKNRLSPSDSSRFLAILSELPIEVEQELPDRMLKEILSLAREHKLTSYDASYLDLAMRTGIPLATLDKKLLQAAAACCVKIFS